MKGDLGGEDYCVECRHYHVKDLKQYPEGPCSEFECNCNDLVRSLGQRYFEDKQPYPDAVPEGKP